MSRKMIGTLSLLLASFLFAVPASAFFLDQCVPSTTPASTNEFVLIAEDNIIFEPQAANSGKTIQGNVLVTSFHPAGGTFNNTGIGFIRVGSNTRIEGTVIADVLFLPDAGAAGSITHCVANTIVGTNLAICGTITAPGGFTAYAAAHPTCVGPLTSGLCGPNPVVNNCVNGQPGVIVGLMSPPLAPGCYGALTIQKGAVAQLQSGVYTFASVNMSVGAKLLGAVVPDGSPPTTTVNVNDKFTTGPGVIISDIKLNVAKDSAGEVVKIFNNSVVSNVIVNAPFGKCHLHTGANFDRCSEVCCEVVDVEPIIATCKENPLVCVCPTGFKFQLPPDPAVFDQSPLSAAARNCVPCQPGDTVDSCLAAPGVDVRQTSQSPAAR